MQGWVKLHRETRDNAVWTSTTPEQKVIFLTLLMMVNHAANSWEWEGDKYHVEPGQKVTSIDSICKAAGKGITPQKVRTALNKFEKWGILTNKSTKRGRLITLINWGKYQREDRKVTDTLTVEQPTGNRQLTTTKECKNEKIKEVVPAANIINSDKEPNPVIKEVVSHYYGLLEEYTGDTPIQQWAKDCSIMKKAADGQIVAQGADKVKDKLKAWFLSADGYTRSNGFPLGLFVKQYNNIKVGSKYPEHDPIDHLPLCVDDCKKCAAVIWEGDKRCRGCGEPVPVKRVIDT